jgi:hypothetical protein
MSDVVFSSAPNTAFPNPNLPTQKSPKILVVIVAVVIVAAGVATGFFLSKGGKKVTSQNNTVSGKDIVQTANEVGSKDTKTFSDKATGVIEKGGSSGEGTHKLIRAGGPSQTVYLISSIVDLDQYVGKKVEVYGQTLRAQKVSWLMDVGRLIILE